MSRDRANTDTPKPGQSLKEPKVLDRLPIGKAIATAFLGQAIAYDNQNRAVSSYGTDVY